MKKKNISKMKLYYADEKFPLQPFYLSEIQNVFRFYYYCEVSEVV